MTPDSKIVDGTRNDNGPYGIHASGSNRGYFFAEKRVGDVLSGDWDVPRIRVEDTLEYQAIEDVVLRGKDWNETEFAKHVTACIRAGNVAYGYASEKSFKLGRKLAVEVLIRSISQNGVLPRSANPLSPLYYDNIFVNVARDGTFLFQGGHHRLCVARVISVRTVPVVVVVRHSQWVSQHGFQLRGGE